MEYLRENVIKTDQSKLKNVVKNDEKSKMKNVIQKSKKIQVKSNIFSNVVKATCTIEKRDRVIVIISVQY